MGRFVKADDVKNRYEGVIPNDRSTWLTTRIDDVEADLILMVPSLGVGDVGQIAPPRADPPPPEKLRDPFAEDTVTLTRQIGRKRGRGQRIREFLKNRKRPGPAFPPRRGS